MISKLQLQCAEVASFNKRLSTCEQKLDASKEQNEKRHESLKDFVQKIKDMLESRVDQITQYEEKFKGMAEAISSMKEI